MFFVSLCLILLLAQQLLLHNRMSFEGGGYSTLDAALVNLQKACNPDQTVILGDSVSLHAIDPRLLDPSVLNASVGGTSPVEIYFIVKNFWKCDAYPKKVILSFTTHHFFLNNGYWSIQDRMKMTWAERLELRRASYRLGDSSIYNIWPKSPSVDTNPQDNVTEFLREIRFPTMYMSHIVSLHELKQNRKTFDFMTQESRGYWTRGDGSGGHISAEHVDINREFTALPILDEYFDKLLELLHSKGIQVYYMQMPISEILYQTQRESFRHDFIDYISQKSHQFDMKILGNFFTTYPNDYFIDDSHFKNSAAQIWTRRIAPLMPH